MIYHDYGRVRLVINSGYHNYRHGLFSKWKQFNYKHKWYSKDLWLVQWIFCPVQTIRCILLWFKKTLSTDYNTNLKLLNYAIKLKMQANILLHNNTKSLKINYIILLNVNLYDYSFNTNWFFSITRYLNISAWYCGSSIQDISGTCVIGYLITVISFIIGGDS